MFVKIDNIKYHLHIKGEGKPIICLHGFSENLSTWNQLELEGYKLILIDLIGHGKSDKPISRKYYKVKVMIKHLNNIINYLGYKKYSMLGYSMGGRIALTYSLTYPNEIEELVLESVSYGECGFLNRLKRRKNDKKLAENIVENGIQWFDEHWSNLSIFDSQKQLPQPIKDDIKRRRLCNEAHGLANTLIKSGQGKFPCLKNKLVNLSMPILYISGEYDYKYRQVGNRFENYVPNIKHITLKGVGHNTHIEKPNAFIELLREFF